MAGHQPFSILRDKMGTARRKKVSAKARRVLVEMELKELRKLAGLTQKQFADVLGVSQPNLSQLEAQRDMQIETLKKLIKNLGGELDIIAHFPDGDVRLTQFADVE